MESKGVERASLNIGQVRVELTMAGLKSAVLPLNYCPRVYYRKLMARIKAGISKR